MKRHNVLVRLAFALVVSQGLLLSGCATHSARLLQESAQQMSDQSVISQVSSKLDTLEARVAEAQASDVETYAPYDMDRALTALSSARRYYEQFKLEPEKVNKSISLFFGETLGEKTLSLIMQANNSLAQAEENKRQADIILSQSNENFKWLKKFNAQVSFPYEYADIERAQKYLISMVARGNLKGARASLPQVLNEQKALEIVAAQHFYLSNISKRIQREGRYDLDRYASISYASSISALNRAKVVIAQDTRNEAAILEVKNQAEFSFEIANAVARDMKRLVDMDREEMERWLILLTTKLHKTGQILGAQDMRNHSVLDQIELIANAAKAQPVEINQAVAVTVPEEAPKVVEAKASADAPADAALVNRVSKLEQTLSQQIKALSEQMKTMQALNQRAAVSVPITTPVATPVEDAYVPLSKRKSLFSY